MAFTTITCFVAIAGACLLSYPYGGFAVFTLGFALQAVWALYLLLTKIEKNTRKVTDEELKTSARGY